MRPEDNEGATPYVQFQNVEVAYNEFVSGLRGVNLTIHKGEFVFLCGFCRARLELCRFNGFFDGNFIFRYIL